VHVILGYVNFYEKIKKCYGNVIFFVCLKDVNVLNNYLGKNVSLQQMNLTDQFKIQVRFIKMFLVNRLKVTYAQLEIEETYRLIMIKEIKGKDT